MELFNQFDKVEYNGVMLTNILRRASSVKSILNRIDVYFDYTIKEGERADTIAYDYYGNSSYTWLIYIANNIYDPYYQWPLTHDQLRKYIIRKYGDYHQAQVDIKHYRHPDKDFTVSHTTLMSWPVEERIGWYPETFYEFEYRMNERKRYIKLISNKYLPQIEQQVKEMFR